MEPLGPEGLSMAVQDAFFIRAPGRGTVLTGQLVGDGRLRVGDYLMCDAMTHEVLGIEQFKRVLKEAGSGANVGLALGEVPLEGFTGKTVWFEPRPADGVPALTPDGWVVPANVAVLVLWSDRRGARASAGALVLAEERVTLFDQDDSPLLDAEAPQVRVKRDSFSLSIATVGRAPIYMDGPNPYLARSPLAAPLIARHKAWVTPDSRLAGKLPRRYRAMVLPNARKLRYRLIWRRVLVTMFETRGINVGPD